NEEHNPKVTMWMSCAVARALAAPVNEEHNPKVTMWMSCTVA
ncbi:hypothetical protein JCM8097_001487, partial [Rhodosporidiobolus ruineniae]